MRRLILAILLLGFTTPGEAADSAKPAAGVDQEVAFNAAGLLSIGTRSQDYAFLPYLDQGLGGAAAGFSVGLGYRRNRLALLGELSSAFPEKTLMGRDVGGSDDAVGEGSRPDTLLSGLLGASLGGPNRRVNLYFGLSVQLRRPTLDGYSVSDPGAAESDPANSEGASYLAFTTGADFTKRLSPRCSFLGTFRYSLVPTSRRANELGIGEHLFRMGAGVSVALSR